MSDNHHSENLTDLVERVLQVRSFPAFARATEEQASYIARRVEEAAFPAGAVLFRKGQVADRFYLIIDGVVRLERDRGPARSGPHEGAGGHSVLEGIPRDSTAIAETPVRAWALRRDEMFDLLEDHFDLALTTIGSLAGFLLRLRGPGADFDLGRWRPLREISEEADLVRRLIYLRSLRETGILTVHGMARLATESTMRSAAAGEVLYRAGEPADTAWLLLRGRVGFQGQESSWEAPFSAGYLHMLAQGRYDESCVVLEPSLLLRTPATAWFDMLEDHFDLVRSLLARLSRLIREHRAQGDLVL